MENDSLRLYTFSRVVLSDTPGFEMDFYKSDDVNGSWMTERGCLCAILNQDYGYGLDVLHFMDEYTLDKELLDLGVYCVFLDSRED